LIITPTSAWMTVDLVRCETAAMAMEEAVNTL
jgi:hypothetical protein